LTDPVVSQQGVFDFCRLPRRCTQPVQNRVFLDPFGARYAADTDPFRQQRQCFHYRLTRGLASIDHWAMCFRKRSSAALAPVPLRPIPGLSKANDLGRRDAAYTSHPSLGQNCPM